MGKFIAIVGKGGTGKSTVSSILIRLLIENGNRPVLAVDADPNSTLAPVLGMPTGPTISDIREDVLKEKASVTGVSKNQLLEAKLEECIQEAEGFDLLTMGRPEGPHCYCYVNGLLRHTLGRLRASYPVTLVDNEAGMEHLSRMNTDTIDYMLMVCEPTMVSARAAVRINALAQQLAVTVKNRILVWNKVVGDGPPTKANDLVKDENFDNVLILPADKEVARLSAEETCVMQADIPGAFTSLLDACS